MHNKSRHFIKLANDVSRLTHHFESQQVFHPGRSQRNRSDVVILCLLRPFPACSLTDSTPVRAAKQLQESLGSQVKIINLATHTFVHHL